MKKRDNLATIEEVVCRNLQIADIGTREEWIRRSDENDYVMCGLEGAAREILKAKNGKIRICSDYDVDGQIAGAELELCLKHLGFKDVEVRIPKHFSEGYGMSAEIVNEFPEDTELVITADNGICCHDAVRRAKERGFKVIVTDHHLPDLSKSGEPILPDADIIIDPHAFSELTADFSDYCGAGIVYMLCHTLIDIADPHGDDEEFKKKLLSYAAIATVADCVPLREHNYAIVKRGLEYLNEGVTFPGINALLESTSLKSDVSEKEIAFIIAPCLNAPQRMSDGNMLAYELLCSDNDADARVLSETIKGINSARKELVKVTFDLALRIIDVMKMADDVPLILNLGPGKEGIAGIIAGRLCEEFMVPVICFSESENDRELMKGSARCYDESVNIRDLIDCARSLTVTLGGHRAAAGVSVKKENFREFKKILQKEAEKLGIEKCSEAEEMYDLEIPASKVAETQRMVRSYAPFGVGNEEPVFKVSNFCVVPTGGRYYRLMSSEGCKLMSDAGVEAFGFGLASKILKEIKDGVSEMIFYGTLTEGVFGGKRTPRISYIDYEVVS